MILRRSLLLRLVLLSLVGGVVAVATLPVLFFFPLTYFQIWPFEESQIDAWAQSRAHAIVRDSLRRRDDGAIFIEQTDDLQSLKKDSPQFRYAVLDIVTKTFVEDSSKELEAVGAFFPGVDVRGFSFHLASDPNTQRYGLSRLAETPIGPVRIITYGAQFNWINLIDRLGNPRTIGMYSPIVLIVIAISVVILSHGLAPLRKLAARVAAIDLDTLNQRVPTANVPSEVTPLVEALNKMLARVDAGVASQRRFAANSAHELRTPIAILRGRVDRMEQSETKFELLRDVRRIQTIADQLLVIARDEARGETVQSEVVNLADTIHDVVADYLPISLDLGRGIEFEAHSSPSTTARASKWALECVARNLIENAVRFEPIGGTVVVRVLPSGTVEVVDHGEGIRQEDREAIFEPFWRKNELTPGAGLGLAIARELIGRYRGRIWVDDTPGGGATFKISLLSAEAGA
jgi:signal transduction histidine kinase